MTIQCEIPAAPDIIPPTPLLIYPNEGDVISNNINVRIEATDNKKVKEVWIYLDGQYMGNATSRPFLVPLDVDTLKDGLQHKIQVAASDKSGNIGYSTLTTFTIAKTQDIIDPTVSILNPQSGQTVEGIVRIAAIADDERSVREVAFFVDGDSIGSDFSYPYQFDWDTTPFADSTNHTVYAKAFDGGNNSSISPVVTVTVFPRSGTTGDNIAPTGLMTYPLAGSVVFGTIKVTIEASDNEEVSRVDLYVDGDSIATDSSAPYQLAWDTSPYADDASHSIYAKVYDTAGNSFTTGSTILTVSSGSSDDVSPPSILVLYPTTGSTVSGTVAIRADAQDNVGVSSVEVLVDGKLEGNMALDSGSWLFNWNSIAKADTNTHTIYLKAYDAAGNVGTSGLTTVTVVAP